MAIKKKTIIWNKLFAYILLFALFIGLIWLVSNSYKRWSIEKLSNSDVLSRLGSHIILPKGDPKKIIRISNIDTLREQNTFYKGIEEGDFIIIYNKKAYIYDSRHDIIRDVIMGE